MIRAEEFIVKKGEPPYWQRRLAELVEQGRAVLRPTAREVHAGRTRREVAASKLARNFMPRLKEHGDILVYFTRSRCALSYRKSNPKPRIKGIVYVPPLPADAFFVGRYRYPMARAAFLRDLIAVMEARP